MAPVMSRVKMLSEVPMGSQSNDEVSFITAIYRSVQTLHCDWISPQDFKYAAETLRNRVSQEGLSFLTKTLPSMGKALDKALLALGPFEHANGFYAKDEDPETSQMREHPKLFGALFRRVLDHDGRVLSGPCEESIRHLRTLLYLFYKYDLPYDDTQIDAVLEAFIQTEAEIKEYNDKFEQALATFEALTGYSKDCGDCWKCGDSDPTAQSLGIVRFVGGYPTPFAVACGNAGFSVHHASVLSRARALLHRALKGLDLKNITPGHGPGAVSTGETLHHKYKLWHIPARLTEVYPLDEYFVASIQHWVDYCQTWDFFDGERPAKVCLVPKDSRGPRLISCEPAAMQWIQQGQRRALYDHVETQPLTRFNVFFTNQQPNQFGALLGSKTGAYATLDLKEASDRVTVGIVQLLFPADIVRCLMASRSLSTKLPDGQEIMLRKFAPMGSAVCFPILALTIWSLLSAGTTDQDIRDGILVYGDDVIVPAEYASTAVETLEAFGLRVNANKSCMSGRFRESCGVDAYNGVDVTPLRVKERMPSVNKTPYALSSWCDYAKALARRSYWDAYWLILKDLEKVFGPIPTACESQGLHVPVVANNMIKKRWNKNLQRFEYKVPMIKPTVVRRSLPGWLLLLRFFTEQAGSSYLDGSPTDPTVSRTGADAPILLETALAAVSQAQVELYTPRANGRDQFSISYVWR